MGKNRKDSSTLVVLLDAFRSEYLNPKDTPFLWKLKDEGIWIKQIFNNGGYCERTCSMCGALPEVSDNFFAMALIPDEYRRAYYEPLFNVPYEIRSRLTMTEDKSVDFEKGSFGVESYWDIMREEGKTFQFEACFALGIRSYKGRTTHGSRPLFILDGFKKHLDYYYLQLSEVDQYAHLLGCESESFRGILRWADGTVEWLWEAFKKEFKHPKIFVGGDHGMATVKYKIDISIEDILHRFRLGYDYLYLKSSAAIQFWSWNEAVDKVLKNNPLLKKYGKFIKSPTPRQASFIWLVKPYYLISPCHFHGVNEEVRAMHGWCLDGKDVIKEMYGGGLIVDGKHKGTIERAELIDWAPTICDLVGLSHYPKQNSGKSILKML
jgi:hypothetical protein